jgi:hypothetical protein
MAALLTAGYIASVSLTSGEERVSEAQSAGQENATRSVSPPPIGQPGQRGWYRHETDTGLPGSTVKTYSLALGPIEHKMGEQYQWLHLDATKANGQRFSVWLLSAGYPPQTLAAARKTIARYILQEGDSEPSEYRNRFTGEAVLPALGGWKALMPRSAIEHDSARQQEIFPQQTYYLGHRYRLQTLDEVVTAALSPSAKVIELLPDVIVGLPSNTRQKDETRRYDDSDYELTPLTSEDFHEMVEAGINCLRVDAKQLQWIKGLNVFYWGVGGGDIPYPECFYRSCYLGPALFLDEPAVGTRDYVIRPRLAKDKTFRKALTPQMVFDAFQEYFRHACQEGAPTSLIKGLAGRAEVSMGDMQFLQENLFSWETMVSTAAYQLSQNPNVPAAMVFEPPGRFGTRRTLPELNMTYGCQLPADDPKNLTSIIYGFLRGAARLTNKSWGMSIYGAVDRADAFWFLTHAYDLGATRFFFWDNYRLACVPYSECLALARNLQAHARNHPRRDLQQLKRAAEIVILLPPGYNLGHVHLGKGSLWGLGELNLERVNRQGVKYRVVMSNFFTEIERCLRLGVAFDLLWDLPGIRLSGYREVVRIREDGKVEIEQDEQRILMEHARAPMRPSGAPPQLSINLSATEGKVPLEITARASVIQKSAPVFYTFGADTKGVYHNAMVAWELYGPGEEDYRFLMPAGLTPQVLKQGALAEVVVRFKIDRPGNYRLRAATVDLAGRTTVTWTPIVVTE